ncbi:unnamed protein product [Ectocarpus sp. 12 AP-2014]
MFGCLSPVLHRRKCRPAEFHARPCWQQFWRVSSAVRRAAFLSIGDAVNALRSPSTRVGQAASISFYTIFAPRTRVVVVMATDPGVSRVTRVSPERPHVQ